MASATSDISKVQTFTGNKQQRRSGKGPRQTSFYKTEVTTLADGGIKSETYRTDAKGNNTVKISDTTTDKDGNVTSKTTLSTATDAERKAFQDPNSRLNKAIKNQTKQADTKAKANSTDPGGGKVDKNEATEPETGDSQSASTPPVNTTKDFGDDMIYPLDMAPNQDVITFTALTYAVKEIKGFSFGARERVGSGSGGSRGRGTVTLPIQSGIKDQNAAGWGEDTMNPLEAMMAKSAFDLVMDGDAKNIGDAGKQIQQNTADFQKGLGAAVVSSATGVKGILGRTQGIVVNPNLELLFQKPTLRPFSFTFKLSARSPDEAKMIVKIIRFFKQNMAPQKGGGSGGTSANLFLKAPNTFQIHYLNRSTGSAGEHKFIGMAKECAMTSLEVDYTPDGNYSTLRDGFMTSYTISMSLKELEPVFYEDYDEFPDTEIGF